MLTYLLLVAALAGQPPAPPTKAPPDVVVKPASTKPAPVKPAAPARTLVYEQSSVRTAHTIQLLRPLGVSQTQYGSGTVIKREADRFWVLSCCHIAEHGGQINPGTLTVTTHKGVRYPARVYAYDQSRDLSLLVVTAKDADVLAAPLAGGETYPAGLAVVKAGHPLAGPRVVLSGKCLNITESSRTWPNWVSFLADAPAISGDSGGVFRSSDGRLVGVIWGGRGGVLRATRLGDIHALLKVAKLSVD